MEITEMIEQFSKDLLEEILKNEGFSSGVITCASFFDVRDGSHLYDTPSIYYGNNGYGNKINNESIIDVASITKLMCYTCLQKAITLKYCDKNHTTSMYLNRRMKDINPYFEEITLYELMNGLTYYGEDSFEDEVINYHKEKGFYPNNDDILEMIIKSYQKRELKMRRYGCRDSFVIQMILNNMNYHSRDREIISDNETTHLTYMDFQYELSGKSAFEVDILRSKIIRVSCNEERDKTRPHDIKALALSCNNQIAPNAGYFMTIDQIIKSIKHIYYNVFHLKSAIEFERNAHEKFGKVDFAHGYMCMNNIFGKDETSYGVTGFTGPALICSPDLGIAVAIITNPLVKSEYCDAMEIKKWQLRRSICREFLRIKNLSNNY